VRFFPPGGAVINVYNLVSKLDIKSGFFLLSSGLAVLSLQWPPTTPVVLERFYFILSKYFIQIFTALEKKEDIILFVKSPGAEENS